MPQEICLSTAGLHPFRRDLRCSLISHFGVATSDDYHFTDELLQLGSLLFDRKGRKADSYRYSHQLSEFSNFAEFHNSCTSDRLEDSEAHSSSSYCTCGNRTSSRWQLRCEPIIQKYPEYQLLMLCSLCCCDELLDLNMYPSCHAQSTSIRDTPKKCLRIDHRIIVFVLHCTCVFYPVVSTWNAHMFIQLWPIFAGPAAVVSVPKPVQVARPG